jgi:hypothetical protein
MDWINLSQYMERVNAAVNFEFHKMLKILFTSSGLLGSQQELCSCS